jgi:hypothetical protein
MCDICASGLASGRFLPCSQPTRLLIAEQRSTGASGDCKMSRTFKAQSLAETRVEPGERRLQMTFVDAAGTRQTVSLPAPVAADLAQVLKALSAELGDSGSTRFTRMPRQMAVGTAQHERLVLIRFDDEPPYGLDVDEAESLWRGLREQTEAVSRLGEPLRQ